MMAKKKSSKKKEEPKPEVTEAPPKEEKPKKKAVLADAYEESEKKPKAEKKSKIKEYAGDWYDKLMGKAGDACQELPDNIQPIAADALKYMTDNKSMFLDLGEEAFKELFNFLGGGEKAKARDHFIRTKLGPDGLIALMKKNNALMKESMEKRAGFEVMFMEFLKVVGKYGLNLLKTLLFS
jgi:hypothetical protein